MAATDSLAFLPTTAVAVKPSLFPLFSPERRSKLHSPKKSPASPALMPRQSSSRLRTASRHHAHILATAADAITSKPPTNTHSRSRRRSEEHTSELQSP